MKKTLVILFVAIISVCCLTACNDTALASEPQGNTADVWCIAQVCLEQALTGQETYATASRVYEIGIEPEVPEGYTREVYNVRFCNAAKGDQKETSIYIAIIYSGDSNITEDEILRFEDLS